MPTFNIVKKSKTKKTFRVASVMGKFDLQSEHVIECFKGDFDLSKEWQIGCIVGNSGTGKTTIAKELFANEYIVSFDYHANSILDDFDRDLSVDEILKMFNAVGFSSPPSWLKPYDVLSQGEKMRVDLARAILQKSDLIVFDEFTSTIDRNVAKIGSAAVAKSIRRIKKKFIAVTCHFDILEWLEPDWIFDTNEMKMKYIRGELRRPKIEIKIYEQRGMWELFRKYHYLNYQINNSAKQYVGYINEIPVTFCGVLHFPHPHARKIKKCTRLVTLPDYQGLGIGNRMLEFVANLYIQNGFRFFIVTSTPALIHHFKSNEHWRLKRASRVTEAKHGILENTTSKKRFTTSWEYNASNL